MSSYGEGLYNKSTSADISQTGTIVVLDSKDRSDVSATLYNASADASYVVESSYDNEDNADRWHALSDQDNTQSFRFQGDVPERWVRMRVDGAAGASNTSTVGIHATK